ncbi:MAG: sigma 54-interacting transcriptional regulator [Deltaproteobacteria bacterium]|nr:sigma 54-interacting transcriptional regulator [Deltaproteobacteria bacterium]
MSTLTLRRSGNALLVIAVTPERRTLGRDGSCDHRIPDDAIAPRQLAFEKRGGLAFLINLAPEGTLLDGNKVVNEAVMRDGSVITLGAMTAVYSAKARDASLAATIVDGAGGTAVLPRAGGIPRGVRLQLRIRRHGVADALRPWDGSAVTIGRDPGCELVLADGTVSERHARLQRDGEDVFVEDLRSRNRVYVEGREVRNAPVRLGETIRVGETELVLEDADAKVAEPVLPGMVGESEAMREVARVVGKVAGTGASVVITGETGTGKGQLARSIHDLSSRADLPFVKVDCARVEPSLAGSEFFGHERGAFTGADRAREGAFENANGGTIFLDEIGELPLVLQAKLLTVLQDREVKREGGNEVRAVDVRVICATHRDLEEMVKAGTFREDLWFRLSTIELELPPLRDRGDDLWRLAENYLRSFGPAGTRVTLGEGARARLALHPFRGNVRELERILERALILREGDTIEEGDLYLDDEPPSVPEGLPAAKPGTLTLHSGAKLDAYLRRIAEWVLERHGGNKSAAASELGKTRHYLRKLLALER